MTPKELEERLTDAEQLLSLLSRRLEKLEERETTPPAHARQQSPGCAARLEELKGLLQRQDLGKHTLQVLNQLSSFEERLAKLPKVLPVRHHHHFEDRARRFVLAVLLCMLFTATAAGLCFSLYRENTRLQETDTKYSLIRQVCPETAQRLDSIFQHAP
ncbi:hypothetical protein [Pontibacter lucknowensis]|uniref:Uncharacterized protein n=1 Tax=Pontibacter lucknowensis TaxID=1077936 RepID=A0A1N6Y1W4_9BACT|nr:hypothetical protein [Pontibacter lucknowensis]SIR08523.1 hypothetical protein SAMN05421545_2208 [Pontibacter lucknowensis]